MTIIQINTFVEIGSVNGFKSWLLAIRLVSWQMRSISSNLPRETPISCFAKIAPDFAIFKEFLVSSISLEEVVIIKFLVEIYKETLLW